MKILRSQEVLWGVLAIAFVSVLIIAVGERHNAVPVQAQTQLAELEGWAWDGDCFDAHGTPNTCEPDELQGGMGWISFNSTNDPGGSPQPFAVTYNTVTGALGGHAWSASGDGAGPLQDGGYGWLSFDRSETFTPPSSDVCSGVGSTACMQGANLAGWARFLIACDDGNAVLPGIQCTQTNSYPNRGGWDGWVKFDGWTDDVALNGIEFRGYAWGGDSVGWISFADPAGGCPPAGKYCVKKKYDFQLTALDACNLIQGDSSCAITVAASMIAGVPQQLTFSLDAAAQALLTSKSITYLFSPTQCTPACSTILTLRASAATPKGSFTIKVTGTDTGGLAHQTREINVAVDIINSCDYVLGNGGDSTLPSTGSDTNPITAFLTPTKDCSSGVTLSAAFVPPAPPGGTVTLNFAGGNNCAPTCTRQLTITTNGATVGNVYQVQVRGIYPGLEDRYSNFAVKISGVVVDSPSDFTFTHKPYADGERCISGGCVIPTLIPHHHFVRDVRIIAVKSTDTDLHVDSADPLNPFNGTAAISVVDVQKDDGYPAGSPLPCIAGANDGCIVNYLANGIGDKDDGINSGADIDTDGTPFKDKFDYQFNNGLLGGAIRGVRAGVPVLLNVYRKNVTDGRYVIKLKAVDENDITKFRETRVVAVICTADPTDPNPDKCKNIGFEEL